MVAAHRALGSTWADPGSADKGWVEKRAPRQAIAASQCDAATLSLSSSFAETPHCPGVCVIVRSGHRALHWAITRLLTALSPDAPHKLRIPTIAAGYPGSSAVLVQRERT